MKVKKNPPRPIIFIIALNVLAVSIFLGCGNSSSSRSSTCDLDVTDNLEGHITDGLKVKLSTNQDTYLSGENPELSLTVTNVSDQSINVTFFNSQESDFIVCRDGMEIWRRSHNSVFLQLITTVTIQPDANYLFTGFSDGIAREIFERKDNSGRIIASGNYTVYGQFDKYYSNKKTIRLE